MNWVVDAINLLRLRKEKRMKKKIYFGLDPDFKKMSGLIVAVAQDYQTKEVLMQAFMNRQAWEKTLESKKAWFWSRSRKKLWLKGNTSGNIMKVKEIRLDCDCDCVLLSVEVCGDKVACHTGSRSCFSLPLNFEGEMT